MERFVKKKFNEKLNKLFWFVVVLDFDNWFDIWYLKIGEKIVS